MAQLPLETVPPDMRCPLNANLPVMLFIDMRCLLNANLPVVLFLDMRCPLNANLLVVLFIHSTLWSCVESDTYINGILQSAVILTV